MFNLSWQTKFFFFEGGVIKVTLTSRRQNCFIFNALMNEWMKKHCNKNCICYRVQANLLFLSEKPERASGYSIRVTKTSGRLQLNSEGVTKEGGSILRTFLLKWFSDVCTTPDRLCLKSAGWPCLLLKVILFQEPVEIKKTPLYRLSSSKRADTLHLKLI